jgi:DNA-directed RNA polymerase specialized sigma24 family protein
VTQVPEGTVKTRIFHAKQALLHCLGGKMTAKDIA